MRRIYEARLSCWIHSPETMGQGGMYTNERTREAAESKYLYMKWLDHARFHLIFRSSQLIRKAPKRLSDTQTWIALLTSLTLVF